MKPRPYTPVIALILALTGMTPVVVAEAANAAYKNNIHLPKDPHPSPRTRNRLTNEQMNTIRGGVLGRTHIFGEGGGVIEPSRKDDVTGWKCEYVDDTGIPQCTNWHSA